MAMGWGSGGVFLRFLSFLFPLSSFLNSPNPHRELGYQTGL
jgi:hypothetical protein